MRRSFYSDSFIDYTQVTIIGHVLASRTYVHNVSNRGWIDKKVLICDLKRKKSEFDAFTELPQQIQEPIWLSASARAW